MRFRTASDRALLVETADLETAMALGAAWADVDGVDELVPGARSVLVHFDPSLVAAAALEQRLRAVDAGGTVREPVRDVEIPVHYDGEDLHDVATLLGLSPEVLVHRHLAAAWRVGFTGFAPGFGYLVGDDPIFLVPRRASPRLRVPTGAVALAGEFTGVYPRESPGGWQLIGRTGEAMWNLDRDPPALLVPGARVRFVRASRERADAAAAVPRAAVPARASAAGPSGPAVAVVHAGMQLLVQDAGRAGLAHLGVSASGAADRTAMHDANRSVGNARDAAVLEGIGALTLRFHGHGVAALAGAEGELTLTGAHGQERDAAHGVPFAVFDGDLLELGHPSRGLRTIIAVAGGFDAARVLGSRSTDTLAGLGPAPLAAGDVLQIGDAQIAAVDPLRITRALPAAGALIELELTLGPRDDWFTAAAVQTLFAQEWTVTSRADRVGIRLQGETPLERAVHEELPSEGAVAGALQVPADGQPVLFGPDHPLTGGYPVIAALTERSRDLAAQLPPGVRVRFTLP